MLNEWADATSDTVGIIAFSRSDWLIKSDRIGQGYTMFTPTSYMISEMKRRQEVVRVCKEAASLMCPTIFDKPVQLPEHLAAIGITIEIICSHEQRKRVGLQSFFLDIENGDMTPQGLCGGVS